MSSYADQIIARRKRVWKILILLGLLLFLSFMALTLFGDSGILINMRVTDEYRALLSERERLRLENDHLKTEIRAMQSNKRKIEEVGRREFGFGRPGEIIFYFPDDSKNPIQKYRVETPNEPKRDVKD